MDAEARISGHHPPRRNERWSLDFVADHGSDFVSRDLDLWASQKNVVLDFSRPGKPADNGFIESFNGKLRAECLNSHGFMSLDDARTKMEEWRKDYTDVRRHSAIGNKPPTAFMNRLPAPRRQPSEKPDFPVPVGLKTGSTSERSPILPTYCLAFFGVGFAQV